MQNAQFGQDFACTLQALQSLLVLFLRATPESSRSRIPGLFFQSWQALHSEAERCTGPACGTGLSVEFG